MAQEKHREPGGGYGPVDEEEAVDFVHYPCSRQQAAGTSALPTAPYCTSTGTGIGVLRRVLGKQGAANSNGSTLLP